MKTWMISILWVFIIVTTILVIISNQEGLEWHPLLIFVLFALGISLFLGLLTLIKALVVAHVPLLLGGLSLFSLCAILEMDYFFILTFLYFIGLMIYFISEQNIHDG
ncbi:hypothetical protein ACFFIS_05780 [Virgibacillus soli]|uniref:hypothetical protein n=1 Tax=Paracerasibacillus soli TaxID=480284 RepID=UPI0035EA50A7